MTLIYCPDATVGANIIPDENEFHHIQVLRIREGESVHVFDGRGHLYEGTIASLAKKSAVIQINDLIKSES